LLESNLDMIESLRTINMYLGLFNKERTTHIRKPILGASPPLFQGFFQVSAMPAQSCLA
jgi:hypothetical protein